jgi:hypothetical protein
MRCWSVKTLRSIAFHGRSFHSYLGSGAVLLTSVLLLTPLPSRSSGPRQRIRRLSRRPWLLGPSRQPRRMRLAPAPPVRDTESAGVVTSFLMPVLRDGRAVLSTGFVGSAYWSVSTPPAP